MTHHLLMLPTLAEQERLNILLEEMGEALQAIGKINRFGWVANADGVIYNNRADLEKELGDVRAAMIRLCNAGDCNKQRIHDRADAKLAAGGTVLHFQVPK